MSTKNIELTLAKREMLIITLLPPKLAPRSLSNEARLPFWAFTSRIHQSEVLFRIAKFLLKEGGVPVAQQPHRIVGERGEPWVDLIDTARKDNKLEPPMWPWNLLTFPIVNKAPGKYRMIQDFRPLNDATIKDGHQIVLWTCSTAKAKISGGPNWNSWVVPPNAHENGASPNYVHVYPKGNHAMVCAGPRYEKFECTIWV